MIIAIEPKKKPCRGITPETKGWGCGNPTFHRHYGLGKMCGCYSKWLLESEPGRIKLKKAQIKAEKPRKELERAESLRNERLSLPRALKLTQDAFNAWIRERDKHKPCISSGNPWKDDHDAGHLFSVKQYSALRFDEDNCHGQSIGENRFNEGNFETYLLNVKERIGAERLDKLLKKAEESKQNIKHWTLDELKAIRTYYRKKLRDI